MIRIILQAIKVIWNHRKFRKDQRNSKVQVKD